MDFYELTMLCAKD